MNIIETANIIAASASHLFADPCAASLASTGAVLLSLIALLRVGNTGTLSAIATKTNE